MSREAFALEADRIDAAHGTHAERQEYLAFRLGGRTYGVAISRVGEILRVPPITPVPRAPTHVLGVVVVRGSVLALVDIRPRLQLDASQDVSQGRVLVVPTAGGESVGVLVDEVLQVVRFSDDEIEPADRALGPEAGEHVQGIARMGDVPVVLLAFDPLIEA